MCVGSESTNLLTQRILSIEPMELLIDYDNVLKPHQRAGLANLCDRILFKVEGEGIALGRRISVRLYGGWYEGSTLSQNAQLLAAEAARDFPRLFRSLTSSTTVPMTVELATSLAIDPATPFHHTFRRQTPPDDVRCHDPRTLGCAHSACPTVQIHDAMRLRKCPEPSCSRDLRELLYRRSQKLVDTMLTVDLLDSPRRSAEPAVVVSSDDDLWPGIHSLLTAGYPAVQVHTRPGSIRRHPYVRPGRAGYVAIELS